MAKKKLEKKRERRHLRQIIKRVDELTRERMRYRLNRPQQAVSAAVGVALLFLLFVPPWAVVQNGQEQFLGFYPLFGGDPSVGLMAYGMHVTIAHSLQLQFFLILLTAGVALIGALALTREDWATLIAKTIQSVPLNTPADQKAIKPVVAMAAKPRKLKTKKVEWHLDRLMRFPEDDPADSVRLERLLLEKISDYIARREFHKAETLLLRTMLATKRQFGDVHPFVAELLFRYANLLRDTERYAAAETAYFRCLELRERLYGSEDLLVATTLRSYARLLRAIGKEKLAKRIEAIAERNSNWGNEMNPEALPVYGDSSFNAFSALETSHSSQKKLQKASF